MVQGLPPGARVLHNPKDSGWTMTRYISTTIYLTPEQKARLKALNERTRVPWAEYVREGIDYVLAKYEGTAAPPAPAPAPAAEQPGLVAGDGNLIDWTAL